MAIIKSTFGKMKGKVGNLVLYDGPNGETLCRSNGHMTGKKTEKQKRHFEAFGTLMRLGIFLRAVIRVGFPGEKRFPAGVRGFVRANVNTAVEVEKIKPEKKVSAQKQAPEEFRGRVDFARLQVADGSLGAPEGVRAEVDAATQTVRFSWPGMELESPCRFRDDRLYGVVVSLNERAISRVFPIGTRGESGDREVSVESEYIRVEHAAVYVFATSADGKKASPSVYLDNTKKH